MSRYVIAVCFLTLGLVAQPQQNALSGALSVNGTGRLDATGQPRPSNSALTPGPGTAPLFHHVSAARASYQVRIDGGANQFYGLFLATSGAPPLPVGPGGAQFVEIDPFSALNLFEGLLSGSGTWMLPPNPGFFFGTPTFFLQAVVTDPGSPGGFRLTASLSNEIRDDLETLQRNFFDAAFQTATNAAYADSITTADFLLDGARKSGGSAAAGLAALTTNQNLVRAQWISTVQNVLANPPLPLGGPTSSGQLQAFRAEVILHYDDGCTGSGPATERFYIHDLQAQESGGTWRFRGNQRLVDIDLYLDFTFGPTFGNQLDIYIGAVVSNPAGVNGTITGVTVTGPNLPAPTVPLTQVSVLGGGTAFGDEVQLTTLPLVADLLGPRDEYVFVISFSNGITTSATDPAYRLALRAALDPALSALWPQIVGNRPSGLGFSVALSNAGTPNATFDITLGSASPPGEPLGPLHGAWACTAITQTATPLIFRSPAIPIDPMLSGPQTVSLCAPNYPSGQSEFSFERSDVYGCGYYIEVLQNF